MDRKPLAIVGETPIYQEDVDFLMAQLGDQLAVFPEEDREERVLDELIRQELLYLDAKKKKVDEEEEFLIQKARAERQLLQQYALHKILAAVEVTEQEVKEYYSAHKNRLDPSQPSDYDSVKQQIYQQLTLLKQQAEYVNRLSAIEKEIPVIRAGKES